MAVELFWKKEVTALTIAGELNSQQMGVKILVQTGNLHWAFLLQLLSLTYGLKRLAIKTAIRRTTSSLLPESM